MRRQPGLDINMLKFDGYIISNDNNASLQWPTISVTPAIAGNGIAGNSVSWILNFANTVLTLKIIKVFCATRLWNFGCASDHVFFSNKSDRCYVYSVLCRASVVALVYLCCKSHAHLLFLSGRPAQWLLFLSCSPSALHQWILRSSQDALTDAHSWPSFVPLSQMKIQSSCKALIYQIFLSFSIRNVSSNLTKNAKLCWLWVLSFAENFIIFECWRCWSSHCSKTYFTPRVFTLSEATKEPLSFWGGLP